MALLDQIRQIRLHRFLGRIGDDHVKCIVDDGALYRERMIFLEHLRQFHADVLCREWDHSGGAAEGRRDGSALECIGIHDACCRKLLDMGMAVDTAWQNQLAPRIDLATRTRQPAADGCNRLTGNGDIGLKHIARGRNASAANQDAVGGLGHGKLLKSRVSRSLDKSTDRAVRLPCTFGADSGPCITGWHGHCFYRASVYDGASSRRKTPCPGRAFSSSIPIPTISLHKGWSKP